MDLNTQLIKDLINKNKGYDIVVCDVQKKTFIAKYMIFASGNSSRHVKALAEHIIKNIKEYSVINVEGMSDGNWVVLSFQDIVVHIFREEVREYYKIEELWI